MLGLVAEPCPVPTAQLGLQPTLPVLNCYFGVSFLLQISTAFPDLGFHADVWMFEAERCKTSVHLSAGPAARAVGGMLLLPPSVPPSPYSWSCPCLATRAVSPCPLQGARC